MRSGEQKVRLAEEGRRLFEEGGDGQAALASCEVAVTRTQRRFWGIAGQSVPAFTRPFLPCLSRANRIIHHFSRRHRLAGINSLHLDDCSHTNVATVMVLEASRSAACGGTLIKQACSYPGNSRHLTETPCNYAHTGSSERWYSTLFFAMYLWRDFCIVRIS